MSEPRWSVVVPIKDLSRAKTRVDLTSELRAELVLAMLADTVDAALASVDVARVLVVTRDLRAAAVAVAAGAEVVQDDGAGLNDAFKIGDRYARQSGARYVAALMGDLPALRTDELSAALDAAIHVPYAFVPDQSREGTTLLAVSVRTGLRPFFGPGSRDQHSRNGARELPGPGWESLRCDVDTLADLDQAVELGVGTHTAAFLAAERPMPLTG